MRGRGRHNHPLNSNTSTLSADWSKKTRAFKTEASCTIAFYGARDLVSFDMMTSISSYRGDLLFHLRPRHLDFESSAIAQYKLGAVITTVITTERTELTSEPHKSTIDSVRYRAAPPRSLISESSTRLAMATIFLRASDEKKKEIKNVQKHGRAAGARRGRGAAGPTGRTHIFLTQGQTSMRAAKEYVVTDGHEYSQAQRATCLLPVS
ncbi:hypothetical protein EVAR_47193_1 [Eumeta japonica]|uniref:Uncharacterized protein n=1 Tax=Eumeta variegata TaxID=151549 RepID=A0A4C1WUZ0_EUMVA|nr:hypothetical protein EVAR_47193_1 [Eumeta japonica]